MQYLSECFHFRITEISNDTGHEDEHSCFGGLEPRLL